MADHFIAFKQQGQNSLAGANALALVVEVDRELLLQRRGVPLFGVIGETLVAARSRSASSDWTASRSRT